MSAVTVRDGRPPRTDLVLYLVAVVLACACIVGGVLCLKHKHDDNQATADPATHAPSTDEQLRYGQVMQAADRTATAMVNVDYRDPKKSYDAVATTATGDFLTQYKSSYDALVKLVTQYRSVMTGHVLSTAVSNLDPDSATVLVATGGRASNAQTGRQQVVRNFRMVIDLKLVDGQWLTSNLEFAG